MEWEKLTGYGFVVVVVEVESLAATMDAPLMRVMARKDLSCMLAEFGIWMVWVAIWFCPGRL